MKKVKLKILFTLIVLSVIPMQANVVPNIDNPEVSATNSVSIHGMKVMESTFSISANIVDKLESFNVSAQFINKADNAFSGSMGVALVDDDDKILEVIGIFGTGLNLPSGHQWSNVYNATCVVSTSISGGEYKIRTIARTTGKDWSIVYGQRESVVDILSLTVTDIVRSNKSELILYNDLDPSFIITPNPVVQGSHIEVKLGVANTGKIPFLGDIILAICKPDGDTLEIVEEIQSLNIGVPNNDEYYIFTFKSSKVNSSAGEYLLTLFQKENVSSDTTLVRDYYSYNNKMPITILGTVSNENIEKQHISVYSGQGFINAVSQISEIKRINIYNLQGVEVYQAKVNDKSFQTTRAFAPGVYIVLIKTDYNIISYKVIIKK